MILAELLHIIDQEQPITIIDVSNNEIILGLDSLPINMMNRTVAYLTYNKGFQIYVLGKDDFIEIYFEDGTTGKLWTDGSNPSYDLLYGYPTESC